MEQGTWKMNQLFEISGDKYHICDLWSTDYQRKVSNAAAICHAVNNTYVIGIDPSKVKDLCEMLDIVAKDPATDTRTAITIQTLLNSAKL